MASPSKFRAQRMLKGLAQRQEQERARDFWQVYWELVNRRPGTTRAITAGRVFRHGLDSELRRTEDNAEIVDE